MVLLITSCIDQEESTSNQTSIAPKVFFYFIPKCPSCEKIKPYMDLLREEVKEVKFDFCDVSNLTSCSNESIDVIRHNLMAVPTAVIIHDNNTTILLGWREVAKVGYNLNKLGIDTPDVFYRHESYDVQDCVNCHNKRNIAPPSTYNCTYCCHYS